MAKTNNSWAIYDIKGRRVSQYHKSWIKVKFKLRKLLKYGN